MKLIRFLVITVVAAGTLMPAAQARAFTAAPGRGDHSSSRGVSPEGYINPDGTLKLDAGLNGTVDISNYSVQLDPQKGPIFGPKPATTSTPPAPIAALGQWAAIGSGAGALDDWVEGMAVRGSNVYVVGSFTNVANIRAADYVAKWNGSAWSALGSNGNGDGSIAFYTHAVAVDSLGNVYVGGDFYYVVDSGVTISGSSHIAKWNGSHWSALGSGSYDYSSSLNGSVWTIATHGTDVYVGGEFTNVDNNGTILPAADYVAKWNGTGWSALGDNGASDGSLNSYVTSLAFDAANNLYVGGWFTDVNNKGTPLNNADYVAKFNGTDWSGLSDDGSGNGALNWYVNALAIDSAGNLYAGGAFTQVYDGSNGLLPHARYVARWDGSHWSGLGSGGYSGGSLNASVSSLFVDGGNLYVGGSFTNVDDSGTVLTAADYVAKWNGSHWSALGSNGAADGSIPGKSSPIVKSIVKLGTKILVGGAFYDLNSNGTLLPQADFIAAWSGTAWLPLGKLVNGALANGYTSTEVEAILVHGNDVYVAGYFINVSNHGINMPEADYIAKWDGANWSALGNNGAGESSVQGWVYALAMDASGNLYAGGNFTHANNFGTDIPQAEYIAKWDGSNWSALGSDGGSHGPLHSTNGQVSSLVFHGSDLYVAGSFDHIYDGTSTPLSGGKYLARYDGTHWYAVGGDGAGGSALDSYATALAVSGSDLYVGGGFTHVYDGTITAVPEAKWIARWDTAGGHWYALGGDGSGGGALDGNVNAIAVYGSDVYAGGTFTHVYDGSTTALTGAQYIARWDGSDWSGLSQFGIGGRVDAIYADATGVYAGGMFQTVTNNGVAVPQARYIARWNGSNWSSLGSNGAGGPSLLGDSGSGGVAAIVPRGTNLLVGGEFSNVNNNGKVLVTADYLAAYGTQATVTFVSQGTADGWVLQSGAINASAPTLRIGDDALDQQYVSILSFATSTLPDNAIITGAVLKMKDQGPTPIATDPISLFGGLLLDVASGYFGSLPALQATDFTPSLIPPVAVSPDLTGGVYTMDLGTASGSVNKLGTVGKGLTQIRLRFSSPTASPGVANYLSLSSGNAASAADRPKLIVTYCLP